VGKPVAARQILFRGNYLYMIDAAGQLWVAFVTGKADVHGWTRIELPNA